MQQCHREKHTCVRTCAHVSPLLPFMSHIHTKQQLSKHTAQHRFPSFSGNVLKLPGMPQCAEVSRHKPMIRIILSCLDAADSNLLR